MYRSRGILTPERSRYERTTDCCRPRSIARVVHGIVQPASVLLDANSRGRSCCSSWHASTRGSIDDDHDPVTGADRNPHASGIKSVPVVLPYVK